MATYAATGPTDMDAPESALVRSGEMSDATRRAWIEELYREYHQPIARHLLALTRDASVVDDLISETFLRAYRALDRFEGRSKISSWLHGIAINVARNHQELTGRRARLDRRFAEMASASAEPAPAPAAEGDALAHLRQALDELPLPLREVFVLRVLEERPWKEVSAILNMPISTLHGRVAQAEALVRAKLGGEP